jgi:hypothetical protein
MKAIDKSPTTIDIRIPKLMPANSFGTLLSMISEF